MGCLRATVVRATVVSATVVRATVGVGAGAGPKGHLGFLHHVSIQFQPRHNLAAGAAMVVDGDGLAAGAAMVVGGGGLAAEGQLASGHSRL